MTRTPLPRAALLAVVLVTAACGGGQDDGRASGGATASAGSSSGSAATSSGSAGSASTPARSGGSTTTKPKAGTPLSPAGGTTKPTAANTSQLRKNLSAPQRRFVTRNAPPGIDAEAILQSGEDACSRMTIAAASSGPDAVAVALVSGQIANGREAIRYLCPQLKSALTAAEQGFPDGSYVVASTFRPGREVAAGRYTAPQAAPECAWSLTAADGKVVAEGNGTAKATVTLRRAQRFTSSSCGAWLRS